MLKNEEMPEGDVSLGSVGFGFVCEWLWHRVGDGNEGLVCWQRAGEPPRMIR